MSSPSSFGFRQPASHTTPVPLTPASKGVKIPFIPVPPLIPRGEVGREGESRRYWGNGNMIWDKICVTYSCLVIERNGQVREGCIDKVVNANDVMYGFNEGVSVGRMIDGVFLWCL